MKSPYILFNHHGKTSYQNEFLSPTECDFYFNYFLQQLPWKADEYKQYGVVKQTKRQIVWFGDDGIDFKYSGTHRQALPWNIHVLKIKQRVEQYTDVPFNSCLLNLYHDGSQGMSWHNDDQNHLGIHSKVVSVSLGCERYFKIRFADKKKITSCVEQYKILLEAGSILVMEGPTQQFWDHEIPKMLAIKEPRISLTFRYMK